MAVRFVEGMVVRSNAGHDGERFYVLVRLEAGYGYIADGKRRKSEKPKRKNLRHLQKTATVLTPFEYDTNQKLRRALKRFNEPMADAVR